MNTEGEWNVILCPSWCGFEYREDPEGKDFYKSKKHDIYFRFNKLGLRGGERKCDYLGVYERKGGSFEEVTYIDRNSVKRSIWRLKEGSFEEIKEKYIDKGSIENHIRDRLDKMPKKKPYWTV